MRASRLVFEQQYSDGSGAQFSVRLDNDDVQIEAYSQVVELPVMELEWLISALLRIRDELRNAA